jgi:hypothetical protein
MSDNEKKKKPSFSAPNDKHEGGGRKHWKKKKTFLIYITIYNNIESHTMWKGDKTLLSSDTLYNTERKSNYDDHGDRSGFLAFGSWSLTAGYIYR